MFEVEFEALTSGFMTVTFWEEFVDFYALIIGQTTGAGVGYETTALLGGDGATFGATVVAFTCTWEISGFATGIGGA